MAANTRNRPELGALDVEGVGFFRPRRQLLTSDDAVLAVAQHRKPCTDCPWARSSINGWLGGMTSAEWLAAAHGEERIDCHVFDGAECAGAAIYRANVCKRVRDRTQLTLDPDEARVFRTPGEFAAHHAASPIIRPPTRAR